MLFDIKVFKNSSFKDHRGHYWTSWKKGTNSKIQFKHDKFSLSKKNVLRGLHGDRKTWKLISCPYGKFFMVVVDLNKKSKTYLKWDGVTLSASENKMIYIPKGVAHGFQTLEEDSWLLYLHTEKYTPGAEKGLNPLDPKLNIKWPKSVVNMSEKDLSREYL